MSYAEAVGLRLSDSGFQAFLKFGFAILPLLVMLVKGPLRCLSVSGEMLGVFMVDQAKLAF